MPTRPNPFRQPATLWTFGVSGGVLALTAVILTAIALWPMRPPDVMQDDVTKVAGFFMHRDFNRLSPRERLEYMRMMTQRYQAFDPEEAAKLAMFIADMNYAMRQQIEENMRRLAVDFMSEAAHEYTYLPPQDRERFLREFLLEMDKMGEEMSGRERDLTDEERLARMNRHAQREQERMDSRAGTNVEAQRVDWLFQTYNSDVAEQVPAVQRGQIARFMLDLTRVRRGERLGG